MDSLSIYYQQNILQDCMGHYVLALKMIRIFFPKYFEISSEVI